LLARRPDVTPAPAALGLATRYQYDANGKRTETTDPLGRKTVEAYDGLNRLLSRQLPMGVSEAFEHDVDGRLFRHVDRRGIVRTPCFAPEKEGS
jgi:YD repeat-containing protein